MAAALTLREVLRGVPLRYSLAGSPLLEKRVAGLEYDSRRAQPDFVFFAFQGSHADGRAFAEEALRKGAIAVVSEMSVPAGISADVWIEVTHGRKALAIAAGNFYGHPDRRVRLIGVTGTNGKTTITFLIDAILRHAGRVTGMIGTIEYRVAGEVRKAANTTPESLDIFRLLADLEQRGGTHLTMEVSSHALALARVHELFYYIAVFTNLTQDHLDFHLTMDAYAAAKRMLFAPETGEGPRWTVLNADDPASTQMLPAEGCKVIWYGMSEGADLRAENIRASFEGLHFELVYQGQRQPVDSRLVGGFNVSNILAAAGAALSDGLSLQTIAEGIAASSAVPGRFERVHFRNAAGAQPFLVVVDYAHTHDALRNVIGVARALIESAPVRNGRVITLFGCGGDRDRSKRPLMGAVAGELSDFVVLTSDNPRSEDPLDIMNDVMVGLGRFDTPHVSEPDRAKAMWRAIEEARPGDIVLLAGKGHEPYQILKDRTIEFDDRETARRILRSLGYDSVAE